MSSIMLQAEIQLLISQYGENAVKEALMTVLKKELDSCQCDNYKEEDNGDISRN